MGIPEKIKAIEDEIHKTQINKATEFHVGLLKAKIARLKREMEENTHGRVVSTGGASAGFDIRKAGDATVVLIGLPSVGKSTLLNALTNAKSRVASYQFTTLTAVPGMMEYSGSKIQILDMPGIIEGAASGKGLGKRVLSVARTADLVLIVLDVFQPHHLSVLKKELSEIGIKVDQKPPNVIIEKTSTGGISVHIQVPVSISERLIKEILHVYGIHNGRIIIREQGLTDDQLIDVLSGNRIYVPSLTVLNKIDLVNQGFLKEVQSKIGNNFIPISADANINIDALKLTIYERLDLIRIYLRRKTGETDYEEPLVIRSGSNVGTVCNKIHRKMIRDFKYAQVWGRSVKFSGQKVGLDHTLLDEDVLTITKKVSAY
ncbi:MAG TPA: GTP-binding protein [Nitrososphaeraceae archaeon]|jgi:small GTP-binding protein|nr:GTP-binding protein [Nitrososphaeraceae archaeon]